jgi:hypothetical protein
MKNIISISRNRLNNYFTFILRGIDDPVHLNESGKKILGNIFCDNIDKELLLMNPLYRSLESNAVTSLLPALRIMMEFIGTKGNGYFDSETTKSCLYPHSELGNALSILNKMCRLRHSQTKFLGLSTLTNNYFCPLVLRK